jgi:N-acetylmuramoyl-L-alanine amidase
VWDDDNQPRFIEDDADNNGDNHPNKAANTNNDKRGKSKPPSADQPDQSKNNQPSRDQRNSRQERLDRRAERAARAERMAKAANEQSARDQRAGQKDVSPNQPTNTSEIKNSSSDKQAEPPSELPLPSSPTPLTPDSSISPDELPASDIFMEIMRRAAATNASREERRRESEARRSRPPEANTPPAAPTKPAAPSPDDLFKPPEVNKADDRPLWQQMRDYTPPTPLERALASLSTFGTEEKTDPSANDKEDTVEFQETSPVETNSSAHLSNLWDADPTALVDESSTEEFIDTQAEIEAEAASPVIDSTPSRRAARVSLAQSLADVMTAEDEQQEQESDTAVDQADVPVGEALPTHPLTDEERVAAAKLEAQRVRRIKKRQQERRQRRVSVLGGIIRSFLVVIPSALLMATILSWWTDPQFLRPEMRHNIQSAIIAEGATPIPPTAFPTPNWARVIGIVSGHSGPGQTMPYDPGAICEDIESLNEHDINMQTAIQVVRKLRERGYVVDLLDEFDPRLTGYQAAALVSIHSNTCQDFGEIVSGFLVAKAEARPEGSVDTQLAECIGKYYNNLTQLERRFGLTEDMTDYHSFREIDVDTPAAIIELGFMRADRDILNDQPDVMAEGIVQGIMCFLEPQLDTLPDPTASPTP